MPLHPKLVHLPIALAVLMPLISTGLLLAWWRGALQRRTWILAIALQGLLVVSGVLASQTGEADEERAEQVVAEAAIEAHEAAAQTFVVASAAVLAIVLVAGVIRRESIARGFAALGVVGTVVVLGLGYRVGDAGGRLVYEHGAATAFTSAGGGGTETGPTASESRDVTGRAGGPASDGDDDHDD
jgi:uncharacterized membrane protein